MKLFAGLDLNASRVRAVSGSATSIPRSLDLDGEKDGALPLALSLENRRPEVGHRATNICRQLPHLACLNFLPYLGEPRRWGTGRQSLDADKALALICKKLQPSLAECAGLALALPAYLSRSQTNAASNVLKQTKLPLLGWVSSPLAIACVAHAHQPWAGPALVLEVDDHALTGSVVTVDDAPAAPQGRLLAVQTMPALGLLSWKERLLQEIAERCIRQSRRDPRDSSSAEQMLWDQLDKGMEACGRGDLVELIVQTDHWYQDLVLRPGEFEGYCTSLVREALAGLYELQRAVNSRSLPVLATAAVRRLPGLLSSFGHRTLGADAAAQAALELAMRWHDGSLPRGPIERTITLKKSTKSKVQGPKFPAVSQQTKLPARGTKRLRAVDGDDDFSVRIDE
jgi:hypothetical protein